MTDTQRHSSQGPFRAEHLRDGDRYELSNGHPIYCAPAEVEVWLRASHDPASLRRWLLLAARVERAEALIDAESGSKSASGPLPG